MKLFIYLVFLQLVDIIITISVITGGGGEANPLMAFFMNNLGNLLGLIVVKSIFLSVILVGVLKNVRYIREGLLIACVYYSVGLLIILGYLIS